MSLLVSRSQYADASICRCRGADTGACLRRERALELTLFSNCTGCSMSYRVDGSRCQLLGRKLSYLRRCESSRRSHGSTSSETRKITRNFVF